MDKKRVAGKLLYGVKYEPKVGGGKRTTYLKDGSGARAHTISYSDGCVTVYQHRDGRITGYHADSRGNTLSKFDQPEGKRINRHPHHDEGPPRSVPDRPSMLQLFADSWRRAINMYRR
jgi:hypothetical protein